MKRKLLLFVCLALQLAIYADPVEIDLSSGSYTGKFTKGQSYTVAGQTDFSGWYVDPDFFTVSINDNLVFRAASGVYKVTADLSGHSIVADRIWDGGEGDAHWTYKEEYNPDTKEGAIWVTGADGSIGLPRYTTGSDWSNVYCVPRVATNIFEITLTVGQELNASDVNFKFRGTPYNWDKAFNGSDGSTYKISTTSTVFGVGTGTDGHDDGNIYLKDGQTLTTGDTYKFRLDCTNAYNIQLTVQKMTVPVSPTPSHAAGQVLSVFSDSYTNQAGTQRVKYKQDNNNYQAVAEKTFKDAPANSYYEAELNNGWVILRNTTVVDASKYDYLHVDLYRQYFGDGDNTFYVYPRSSSDLPADDAAEGKTAFESQQATVTEGQWVSFDIPLYDKNDTYKGYMEQMEQLLVTGAGQGILAIDNIYFWRELDAATLTSAHGTTVYQHATHPLTPVFTDKGGDEIALSDISDLTYTLDSGVGSISSDGVFTSDATGTAVVKVEGTFAGVTKDATLTITVQKIPESPDPVQTESARVNPTDDVHHAADVVSVFSNSYLKHAHFLDGTIWKDGGAVTKYNFDDDSNNVFAVFDSFSNYVTPAFGGDLDVSGYTHLHVDVFQLTGDADKTLYAFPKAGEGNPTDQRTENTALACERGTWKSFDIDLTQSPFDAITTYSQVVFLSQDGTPANESFAIDNVYFWREQPADPVTTDTDGKGINWNSTTGTTCYVDKLVWEMKANAPMTGNASFAKAHDGNNLTYHTITQEQLAGQEHAQFLLQLTKPIRVSDVELVWANGFPKTYNVYAFAEFPLVNSAVPASLLTEDNKLFGFANHMLPTDPYIETVSNLQNKVSQEVQYILIDMIERGEQATFGYYLCEVHVGAYDDSYNTPDHLGIPDYTIPTDVDQTLEVTVRNRRNAIIQGATYREGSVTTSWNSSMLKKRNNQETVVYATSSGEYTVTVNGELSDGTPLNPGSAIITADKNWIVNNAVQSIVQQLYAKYSSNATKLAELFTASRTENGYNPWLVGDNQLAADDILSRWSSFDNTDGTGYIPWDNTTEAANRRKEWNKNQYLLIDLEKVYEITNIELIWERAYSPEYKVFGFEAANLPANLNDDYATFCETYSSNVLYSGTNSDASISSYPLHDEHSNLSTSGPIREDNRTRYLLIKMNEPAEQNADYFGFSLWEVYAWGADLTVTDNVRNLSADNISVKAGHEGTVTVKAFGGSYDSATQTYEYEEDNWYPVTFSTVETGYFFKSVEEIDPESGNTLERFYMYHGTDTQADATDANLVAVITDNNNGTYGIVASRHGYGQTQEQYDNGVTDGTANDISFTIQMSSTSTDNTTITGQFELVVYKNPMALLTNGTSTTKNMVYDDGYYDVDVLKANANRETNTIDLRNVDFTFSNDGTALSTAAIPAPHTVKSTGGTQLNPNTIYYTDETTLSGGNLAVKQNDGSWKVDALRIFDGWDWAPLTNEGGMVAGQAYFYTSLKAQQYSFIAMPFVPTFASLNDKQVKLYKPIAYSPRRQVVQIDEMTDADFASGFEGKPYVIRTENENLYKANGYGVVFKSNGEVSVVYNPQTWQDEAHGATITSSYVRKDLTTLDNSQTDYYLFSSAYEMFLPVGDEKLEDDKYNDESKTLSATEVMPFYAYLALDKAQTAGNEVKRVSFFLGQLPADDQEDELTTGIDKLIEEGRVTIYDIQGRRVGCELGSSLPSGIYIMKYSNGETRKINIRK